MYVMMTIKRERRSEKKVFTLSSKSLRKREVMYLSSSSWGVGTQLNAAIKRLIVSLSCLRSKRLDTNGRAR